MKQITVERLIEHKQRLIQERNGRIERLQIGYDNAIAILDVLIEEAMNDSIEMPPNGSETPRAAMRATEEKQ